MTRLNLVRRGRVVWHADDQTKLLCEMADVNAPRAAQLRRTHEERPGVSDGLTAAEE